MSVDSRHKISPAEDANFLYSRVGGSRLFTYKGRMNHTFFADNKSYCWKLKIVN